MGTERELPRPYGMMQKVQRWSQPFCTATRAPDPADGLARLAQGLGRYGTCVDDDSIGNARRSRFAANDLRLVGVEPASERDDIDVPHHATAAPNRDGSKRPSSSYSTG